MSDNTYSDVVIPKQTIDSISSAKKIGLLKIGVWTYFLLIIFEGSLRKWVLPGFATPLLIIRDPLALWLLLMAYKQNQFTTNIYTAVMLIIGIVGTVTAVLLGHGNFPVALYGARILLLHFPLIF